MLCRGCYSQTNVRSRPPLHSPPPIYHRLLSCTVSKPPTTRTSCIRCNHTTKTTIFVPLNHIVVVLFTFHFCCVFIFVRAAYFAFTFMLLLVLTRCCMGGKQTIGGARVLIFHLRIGRNLLFVVYLPSSLFLST